MVNLFTNDIQSILYNACTKCKQMYYFSKFKFLSSGILNTLSSL